MRRGGLLHKTKVHILIVFVLCFQWLGSYHLLNITSANDEVPVTTEPNLTIDSPITNSVLEQTTIKISGTAQNFLSDVSVMIISGSKQFGPVGVKDGTWSIEVDLQTVGTHSFYAVASDSDGTPFNSNVIQVTIVTPTDTTPPEVTFVLPVEGAITKYPSIEVTTEPFSRVEFCINCTELNGLVTGDWKSIPANSDGKWILTDTGLLDGKHTIYARAIDAAGNVGPYQKRTFTLDKTRPIVSPNVYPKQDMTQVPVGVDTKIKVTVIDSTSIKLSEINKSIIVSSSNGSPVSGKIEYDNNTKLLTFTPEKEWAYSTKYHVMVSPLGLIDEAGNNAFPRLWSFTTETRPGVVVDNKKQYSLTYNGENFHRESPHAIYASNVNTCANCHSTHVAGSPNLLNQSNGAEPQPNNNLYVDDYCMACHDGTVAPKHENSDSANKHDAAISSISGKPNGSSCSSCHDPHADWSEENPNLAQGHIVYTHTVENPINPEKPRGQISSKEYMCESCHESDSAKKIREAVGYIVYTHKVDNPIDPEKPTGKISSKDQTCESCHESDLDKKIEEALFQAGTDGYRLFQYKKSTTAIGIYEDYDLCLRCHNQSFKTKYEATPDIGQYYNYLSKKYIYDNFDNVTTFSNRDLTTEKTNSGHIIKAQDGSLLAGQIPCAECHDTHGSNNIKQLKTLIGHENPKPFEALTGDWDAAKERVFCITCHNGETGIYGITGTALFDKTTGITIDPAKTGHNRDNKEACSKCHSNNGSFIEAAHSPKRIKVLP
ncbi:MAG: Ig-like domain-containing protein [Neobacillus sp.]